MPLIAAPDALAAAFALDVAAGFAQHPRMVPPRWLYDELGSRLFDAICELPWYRITRAERALIAAHGQAVIDLMGESLEIVELGGGNGEKLDLLLDAAARRGRDVRVRLIDISQAALDQARDRLASRANPPAVELTRASFEVGLASLGEPQRGATRIVLFLGSNVGNFDPPEARELLRAMADAAGPRGAVLLGVDLVKPESDLLLAYDDPLQVTAAFNRNLLTRMNRDLGANFRLDDFAHQAVWSRHASRIEMRLVAARATEVHIPRAGVTASFDAGDYIWTESSYKYTTDRIGALAEKVGLKVTRQWIDPTAAFALSVLTGCGAAAR